jgi:lysophospholipase L1-like esterase
VLLYGRRQQDSTCVDTANFVLFNGDTIALDGRKLVNDLPLEGGDPGLVELGFLLKPDQPIYGVSFQSDAGIILDNLALRGNSGMAAASIARDMYGSYASQMGADLVVIHYGVNAMALGMTKYSWYRHSMIKAVNYLKESLPNASFLVLSIADRSSKQGGIMQTDSAVYAMNKVLEEVARKTDCAYFDLFSAMGGTGSMVDWVERDRPLANKDYTHFNFRGSKKVADLIVTYLLEEYQKYLENEAMPDHEPDLDPPGPGGM